MRLDGFHLTYSGAVTVAGWPAFFARMRMDAPRLKRRLAVAGPFGVCLRLSADDARALLQSEQLGSLQAFLQDNGLYVFTLNGRMHGDGNCGPVKEAAFSPDWRDPSRVQYTLRLIEILRHLLPRDTEGSISTLPLSYRAWIDTAETATWERMALNIIKVSARLIEIKIAEDRRIHLDLEPEPDGLLANSGDVVTFFERYLLPLGVPWLARRMKLTRAGAEARLLDLTRVCLDTCHLAVAFEEPLAALTRLRKAGIKIGKLQVAAALRVPGGNGTRNGLARALSALADDTHLHQVVVRGDDGALTRYPDLPEALPALASNGHAEWRANFHLALHRDLPAPFTSTRDCTQEILSALRTQRFTRHLEIETDSQLLAQSVPADTTESVAREYEWVQTALRTETPTAVHDA